MEERVRKILRVIRTFIYRFCELFLPEITTRQYAGYTIFYKKGPSIIDRIRFLSPTKIYERKISERISEELNKKKDPIFFDIGSNLGLISLYVLRNVVNVKVYAFEPGLLQRSLMGLTLSANKLTSLIQMYSYALSNHSGLSTFTSYEDSTDGSGDGFINTNRVINDEFVTTVETITLDEFCLKNSVSKIDVIKIDIEGAELLALRGSIESIKKFKPVVFFELNTLNLRNYDHSHTETLDLFFEIGYQVKDMGGVTCTHDNILSLMENDDMFIAAPKN